MQHFIRHAPAIIGCAMPSPLSIDSYSLTICFKLQRNLHSTCISTPHNASNVAWEDFPQLSREFVQGIVVMRIYCQNRVQCKQPLAKTRFSYDAYRRCDRTYPATVLPGPGRPSR